jgi:sugar phosphate isomerase/epimerase
VIDALYEGGFQGVLSIEHEDPTWGGTPDLVEKGLELARRTLRPLMVG